MTYSKWILILKHYLLRNKVGFKEEKSQHLFKSYLVRLFFPPAYTWCISFTTAHIAGQNLNTDISVFSIYETVVLILIPIFQKQTFFKIHFDDIYVQYNAARKKPVITWVHVWNKTFITVIYIFWQKLLKIQLFYKQIYIYIYVFIYTANLSYV